ncbi:MAG: hypothetical protein ABIQ88_11110 [Chitinophagaceae bacterium]
MKKYLPLLSGLSFVAVIVAVLEYVALKKTGGHFCYPLDDTFIHMAVSKNLALYGNWGITPHQFVSSSSSPLFTIVLALFFKLFSISTLMPFVISCIGTVLMLLSIQRELTSHSSLTAFNKVICVIVTLLVGTIPALTLLGMEHTLQIAFTLFFVHRMASVLTAPQKQNIWQAAAWGACMTFTRYENAFFIMAAFSLLVWQKNIKSALFISLAGALPLVLFGLYSKMHGGYFLPNSVLIKGNQNLKYFLNGGTSVLQATGTISAIMLVAIIICFRKLQTKKTDRDFWILALLIIAGLLHSVLASFGWFYRYEAYLIVLGSLHLSKLALQWFQQNGFAGLKRQMVPVALLAVLFYSLPVRGLNSLRNSIRAIYNIYEQQYQMGTFLKQYYKGQTVAANDIGAISYMADLNTIDMWGLGNNEIATARKNGYWNNAFLQKVVKENNTRVTVMYDSWFDKELTKPWVKVATWEMPYNYICGDIYVTFYGNTEAEAILLKNNLAAFEEQLPKDIKVKYFNEAARP